MQSGSFSLQCPNSGLHSGVTPATRNSGRSDHSGARSIRSAPQRQHHRSVAPGVRSTITTSNSCMDAAYQVRALRGAA